MTGVGPLGGLTRVSDTSNGTASEQDWSRDAGGDTSNRTASGQDWSRDAEAILRTRPLQAGLVEGRWCDTPNGTAPGRTDRGTLGQDWSKGVDSIPRADMRAPGPGIAPRRIGQVAVRDCLGGSASAVYHLRQVQQITGNQ